MARRKKVEENNNTNIPEENTPEVNSETTATITEPTENQEPQENSVDENEITVKSRVKIKSGVENDMLGRRIHNGIKNYVYTVLAVRNDGYCTIECLTYVFTLSKDNLILVR